MPPTPEARTLHFFTFQHIISCKINTLFLKNKIFRRKYFIKYCFCNILQHPVYILHRSVYNLHRSVSLLQPSVHIYLYIFD